MAAKKEIRSDNTYIISQDTTDNPKLGAKILSDGRESLFLDYYLGYQMVYSEKLDKEVARKDRKREKSPEQFLIYSILSGGFHYTI